MCQNWDDMHFVRKFATLSKISTEKLTKINKTFSEKTGSKGLGANFYQAAAPFGTKLSALKKPSG